MSTPGPAPVPVPAPNTTSGPPTTGPARVSPQVDTGVPANTPTLVPRSQIDQAPAPVPANSVPGGNVITLAVPVQEITVDVVATAANTTSNVVVYSPKPGGLTYAVQYNAGNNVFGGTGQFEWDVVNGLVKIGNSYGGYKPTDLFVQGNIMIGEIQSRTGAKPFGYGYAEIGRIRYLDDQGYANARYPTVYGFSVAPGEPLYENWMCIVNEPGHETNTATSVVLGLGDANGNSTLFGLSVNSTNARGTKLNNPYWSPIYSDPGATGWQQLVRITGKDVFLPQLSNATGNKFLAYNTANGRITYTDGVGNSSVTVQEEGSNVVSSGTINFVGAGVTASNVGGVATITVSGSGIGGIAVQEEGSNVVSSANTINFIGSGVTASNVGGVATITVASGLSGLAVQEEGTNVVSTANTVNFVGAGVTASNVGGVATITVSGGGSGITVQEESSTVVATATTVNFLGAGVTASNVSGVAVVTVPGGVNTMYDSSPVTTPAQTINFVGPLANVTNVGFGTDTTDVVIGLTVQDESTVVTGNAAIGTLNFLGAGVTVTAGPTGVANITIPSGGGTPGSPNASIQFNDNGSFAGNTYFTFNKTNGNVDMGLGNLTVSNGNITGYTNGIPLGYKYLPGNSVTSNRDISSADIGGYIVKWGNSDITLTTPGFPGDTNLPVGTKIEIFNANPTGNANIVAGSGGGTSTVLVGPRPNAEGILSYVQVGPYEQVTLVKLGASATGTYTGNSVVWFCYGSAYPLGVAYP